VFDEALFAFVASADLCIAPDRVNAMNDKSTMNKIMDYMAMGKPIVQFEVTEGRWSAGAASLYATPNDTADMAAKIVELADDPHARARMGAFGQARYHDALAWPHQVPALIAAYEHAAR
jgi:glycosyltransferase involved in cell wall biosynthesis